MTRPLDSMSPDEVLRDYFGERRRRESPPSLAGLDPDAPREKKPPSGRYEETLLLLVGCDRIMLECMFAVSSMYKLASWTCPIEDCEQVVQHEHRVVLDESGRPLTVQGREVTEPVTVAVHPSAVAQEYGIPIADVKRRMAAVLAQVAENQGRRRGAARVDEYEEDPAVEAWRLWCARGGM